MIRNIKLFINNNEKSLEVARLAEEKFKLSGFNISNDNFDLGVAIGGDGSFLRMVKNTEFDSNPYYVGINTGTLGFMQEVRPDEIDTLINEIIYEKYKVDDIGIQETEINYDGLSKQFYNLNEIVIRDNNFKLVKASVKIDDDLLENYTGDGILIATSCGSTAQNLSYGGSIVYPSFSTLQITPFGPVNSKSYSALPNSVIVPSYKRIKVEPNNKNEDYVVSIDGKYNVFNNVEEITTSIQNKKIRMLRFSRYNFPQKINEKFLSNQI